jgi:hypothetical protein
MTPDPSFVRALTAYDAKLRVRFGVHTGLFLIERKMALRNPAWLAERPLNPFGRGARAKDLWAGWRAGYCHVLSVHPSLLYWSQVAPELARTDREQAGSWQALTDQLEAVDAQMEAERQRTLTNWSESAAKDAADHLMVLEGHTVFTPPDPSGVLPSDRVEQHPDGFVVRVRKGAHH